MLAHPDHFVEYNALVTPPHIVPEWYFLPFYAILRGITFGVNIYLVIGLALVAFGVWDWLYRGKGKRNLTKWVKLALLAGGLFCALGYLSQYETAAGTKALALPLATDVFVDAKLGGVLAMFGAVAMLFLLPWLDSHPVRSARFRPLFKLFTLVLVLDFIILGWVGMSTADAVLFSFGAFKVPMVWLGQLGTAYYFAYFLVVLPWLSRYEQALPLPNSINEAVLAQKNH
jgi:quinol-cytochrome oxidoreductase complex cytochrome b subunit